MKVLITGIGGFVGSTLAKEFASASAFDQIVGIDNFSRRGSELNRGPLEKLGIKVFVGDIRNSSDVDALPKTDWVIDAAANPSVLAGVDGKVSSRQLVEHNLLGTINLLEYCKRHASGFVLLSTSRVYSIVPLASVDVEVVNDAYTPRKVSKLPHGMSLEGVDETFSTTPPLSLYGSTKVASEQMALEYGATFGFPVWINRCGVMAGAGQFGHPAQGIFAYWIHSFRERRPLSYIGFGGHGFQVRDCLHPRDLVPLLSRQMAESLSSNRPRIVNVGGGIDNTASLRRLTNWCSRRFGAMDVSQVTTERPFDLPWVVLNPQLALTTWDWQARTSLEQILDEIAQHAECHPNWLEMCV